MIFRNSKKYEVQIIRWYGLKGQCKAIRVEIDGGQYNMPLHTRYVEILSERTAWVWGSWIKMTMRKCKKSNKLFQQNRVNR